MKTLTIVLIIVGVLSLSYLASPDMQSIINPQVFTYSYNWDIDAPPQSPLLIGSDRFSIRSVSYKQECGLNLDYDAPEPNPECWNTSILFQDDTIDYFYGEEKPVNDFLKVRWITNSYIDKDKKTGKVAMRPQTSFYQFSIYNDDFLESKIIENSNIILLNSGDTMDVQVRSDLANNLKGGFIVSVAHEKTNNIAEHSEIPMTFNKGTRTYNLKLDTSILGPMTVQIQPFIEIMNLRFYDDRVSKVTYDILPKIEDLTLSVDCSTQSCPYGFRCENMSYQSEDYQLCIKGVQEPDMDQTISGLGISTRPLTPAILTVVVLFILAIIWGIKSRK